MPMGARSISEPGFQPQCADFADRVRESLGQQKMMTLLGIGLGRVAPGAVDLEMAFNPQAVQHMGFHHAGVSTTGMDSACGYAAYTLMAREASVVTVEFKTSFLAPGIGECFRFEGRVIKPGRTLTFCEGRAVAITGDTEKLIATMTATMMAVM